MSRALKAIYATIWGAGAILNFGLYAAKPELNNIDLVKNEAAYVQKYNGQSPTEALDHALESLYIVEATNPDNAQDILAMKEGLIQYKSEISTLLSGEVNYQDLGAVSEKMEAASSDLEKFAYDNTKNDSKLVVAGLDTLLCSFWAVSAVVDDED